MEDEIEAVIYTKALTKLYGKVVGVRSLDLKVQPGEIFGFLGPNGSGKTTTIRLLTGFLHPTSGSATVLGMDAWRDSTKIKARIGFLPDFPSLYLNLTGEELLDYMAHLNGGIEASWRHALSDRLELGQGDLRRKIKEYSRGMQQKLAIILTLQHKPTLLIMDEPTEGLDPLMQQSLFHLLQEFQQQGGTVFMSSHILPDVERLCHRVAIIRRGTLVAVETVDTLRSRYVRQMEVTLSREPPEELELPGASIIHRDGNSIRLLIRGELNSLLNALTNLGVEEMVFEQAHLEDIFLDLYREEVK